MTDAQHMIQLLSSLTSDYKLQMFLMENRFGNKENPFTIDEQREEVSLRFKRLSLKYESSNESDLTKEKEMLTSQFKVLRVYLITMKFQKGFLLEW